MSKKVNTNAEEVMEEVVETTEVAEVEETEEVTEVKESKFKKVLNGAKKHAGKIAIGAGFFIGGLLLGSKLGSSGNYDYESDGDLDVTELLPESDDTIE